MFQALSRRNLLKTAVLGCTSAALASPAVAGPIAKPRHGDGGVISGLMTGAAALVEALVRDGVACVYGIPGAQDNELWDTMKSLGLPYLLVTHEMSAACMADGYARSTGKPGVVCLVPGPGVTNALTGLGEALLDSSPVVAIVCDVDRGPKGRPFQVHDLPNVELLKPVCKAVFPVCEVGEIPLTVRRALAIASSGEPGPVAVVVPYPLFIESHRFHCPPVAAPAVPFDEGACQRALGLLANPRLRVGIYAGQGCMDTGPALVQAAELLQAPVATSVSGKGAFPETHPLAVGWGYGPHATRTAEKVFADVDLLLAIGVRYSEVSTGFYGNPQHRGLIHVDANANNLGRVMRADVCVHADSGAFLSALLAQSECLRRPPDTRLPIKVAGLKRLDREQNGTSYARCGVDPMILVGALRRASCPDALFFVDVTLAEHFAAEAFSVGQSRCYFNPTDNQSMGWSIPAAIGAQRVHPGRQTLTLTGDGSFLMSAMEMSTAAREGLPVKVFLLDDGAYHYMQGVQKPAYGRTTATILARLDYACLAKGLGVGYHEITQEADLESSVRAALCREGPVLVRVTCDYGKRPVRWIEAVRKRYTDGLSTAQKARFLARLGGRGLHLRKEND